MFIADMYGKLITVIHTRACGNTTKMEREREMLKIFSMHACRVCVCVRVLLYKCIQINFRLSRAIFSFFARRSCVFIY